MEFYSSRRIGFRQRESVGKAVCGGYNITGRSTPKSFITLVSVSVGRDISIYGLSFLLRDLRQIYSQGAGYHVSPLLRSNSPKFTHDMFSDAADHKLWRNQHKSSGMEFAWLMISENPAFPI